MRHDLRPEAILIAGPTASGKSALAIELAERIDGVVINADSMQVYRDLRILSARPTAADEARAPHRLYGTVDGALAYSVHQWLADVADALEEAKASGLIPIVVGGTGLYFKALTQGLSDIPSVPADVRAHWRDWAHGKSAAALHAELTARDPTTAARLRPTDPQRVLRALEVHAATGLGLSVLQGRRAPALLPSAKFESRQIIGVALSVDRAELRTRTSLRIDEMLENGAPEEVAALLDRDLAYDLPVMRALGVPELIRHIRGETNLAAASAEMKTATHAYLKRQTTFFRHQLPHFAAATSADVLAQFA